MLRRCLTIIGKMKAATDRQKNISMDVKMGLAELEELIDAIASSSLEKAKWGLAAAAPTLTDHGAEPAPISTPTQKRATSNPLPGEKEKKSKEKEKEREDSNPWTQVLSKRKRKKKAKASEGTPARAAETAAPSQGVRKKKRRREAILIKPAQGKSYAEVLGAIRKEANPESTGTEIRSVRQTRAGEVLVELGAKTGDKTAFGESLRAILGDNAMVRSLEPRETVEIRDLDSLSTSEEVTDAIRRDLGELAADLTVSVTGANSRAQRMAIVSIGAKGADRLLKAQHIKIGWVSCRVRQRATVSKCYRCLGYGHLAGTCKGPDRSRLCFKCGGADHRAKECTAPERCFLCAEKGLGPEGLDHTPGSRRCAAFRDALGRTGTLAK